ncbi:MAG TPA: phage portal protein, partial [Nocardioides sp.]|nr:phage portal protein [Nocardioides sp.]
IRRAILLDRLAAVYADNPRPLDYFTDADTPGVMPMDPGQVDAFLAEWQAARKVRGTAWIPGNVQRVDVNAPSPAELQLVELQRQVTLEIANGLGVDPEDLGVSTTSRTYFNAQDRRITKINEGRAPIMKAITDRLSMGDVTRRGYEARFDLTEYLRADPVTQASYWEALQRMGAMDAAEIRAAAGLSGAPPVSRETTSTSTSGIDAGARPPLQLGDITPAPRALGFADDTGPAFRFTAGEFAEAPAPEVDTEARTITGLALPYNKIARKFGIGYRFRPGSIEWSDVSRVKHFIDHYGAVGRALELHSDDDGLTAKLSVAGGVDGSPQKLQRDQLLHDAADGIYDGLSVGVDFDLDPASGDVEWHEGDQVYDVTRATLREISTTAMPAFDDARVTKVAASRTGGPQMDPCTHCGHRHAPGIACATFAAQLAASHPHTAPTPGPAPTPSPVPAPGPGPTPTPPPSGGEAYTYARPTVNLLAGAPAQVREPAPYRFDSRGWLRAAAHDFSTDLIAGSKGDVATLERAQQFVREQFSRQEFDVDRADAAALNPNRQRPDLYVDQRTYRYPIWEAINKGSLTDSTPFVFPKFSSASGLVATHTEGTEPTPGTYVATSQTVTPGAVSGKVEITREAWDQGGNPQLSGLIWRQMEKAYYEALEARAVAVLDAASPAALATFTAGGGTTGQTLVGELTAGLAALQFVRGGFSMDTMFAQVDLYQALIA